MLHDALGSATAGVISRLCTHPLDTAKARLQAPASNIPHQLSPYRGTFDVLKRTVQHEGIRGLYRGFGAILVGGTPGTMIYLCSYEKIKNTLSYKMGISKDQSISGGENGSSNRAGKQFLVYLSSGMLAETIACVIYVPVDVIKERLQVQQRGGFSQEKYAGSWDALVKIMKNEGLSGIYKGYGATLASFGPFSALYFVFYEKCKYWARQQHRQNQSSVSDNSNAAVDDIPFPYIVACSASSGALASWLTSPLDMAKLRLQVQRGKLAANSTSKADVSYRSMVDCLQIVYRDAGFKGLFRGAGARVIHFAPATTITMTCYEKCRSFYASYFS